ncbi:hypothetical protein MKX03_025971 [Papaver bracteatum]|nr:hypothetical protein MKX03_025971 [Papaver bracteatum]
MNKLKGFISTARLPSYACNFNRGSLVHNGKGRDSPECVLGKATRPGKFQVKDKDLESDDSTMNLYERWMRVFGIFRIDPQEKKRRFIVFKGNVIQSRGAHMFSDMTYEEVKSTCTGLKSDDEEWNSSDIHLSLDSNDETR